MISGQGDADVDISAVDVGMIVNIISGSLDSIVKSGVSIAKFPIVTTILCCSLFFVP